MSLRWNKSLLELTGVSLYVDQKLLTIFMHLPSLECFVLALELVRNSQRHALSTQTQTNTESPGWQTDSEVQLRTAYRRGNLEA